MAKERRATLRPVQGQVSSTPRAESAVPAPTGKTRTGNALYARLPRELKVQISVVAAALQVKQNHLVGAVLNEYVSLDHLDDLRRIVDGFDPDAD